MVSVVGSRTIWLGLLVSTLVAGIPAQFGGVASAGTVDIWSQPGKASNNVSGTNTGILPSPVWAAAGSGYEWVSYGDTGCNTFVVLTGACTPGPSNPVGTTVDGTPTAIFYQTFTITDSSDSGNLNVWADDTAGVWLDNGTVSSGDGSSGVGAQMLYAPNGTLGPNCANAPIGCTTNMDAVIPLTLSAGTYTLVIDAYQLVGGTPFGVMYDGVLTNGDSALGQSTPEPSETMIDGLRCGFGLLVQLRADIIK